MKFNLIILMFLLFFYSLSSNKRVEILDIMSEELFRNLNQLELDNLQKPYYIEYLIKDSKSYGASASNGAIINESTDSSSQLNVDVRVGDYKFDNTNFFDISLGFFGSSDDEERFKRRSIPFNKTRSSVQRELWLSTDAAYKRSAELFSKKEAAIKNRMRRDTTTPDFIKVDMIENHSTISKWQFDREIIQNLIKKLSEKFNNYPEIIRSSVSFEYIEKTHYFVNSEKTRFSKNNHYFGIEVVAATQENDGMPIVDHYTYFGNDGDDFPSYDSLNSAVDFLIENILTCLNSDYLIDSYVGPILYRNQAACQIIAQYFAPNLVLQREPISENSFSTENEFASFQRKIGGRVLPEFLSVFDKPTLEKFDDISLIGRTILDDNGLKTKEMLLVENGYLKSLLSERIPNKSQQELNANKRAGSAMYSNLFIENNDKENILDESQLIDTLLSYCQKRKLEFAIIIDKIIDQNIRYTTLFRLTYGGIELPMGKKTMVLEGRKVFLNGKVERFRGALMSNINAQNFKDITFTGNKSYVLNFLAQPVISPYLSGGEQFTTASIISPSLLFEDGEIRVLEDEFRKPPIVSNPLKK